MKTQVATRQVAVVARVSFKHNPKAVCYVVRSGSQPDVLYHTKLYNGRAISCDCPAGMVGKPCYHRGQCETREQSRSLVIAGPPNGSREFSLMR